MDKLREDAERRSQMINNEIDDNENEYNTNSNIILDEPTNINEQMKKSKKNWKENKNSIVQSEVNHNGWSRPIWVNDKDVNSCQQCQKEFDWIIRRHHCRHCGNIFCNKCSKGRALLPIEYENRNPVRVCDSCYTILLPIQETLYTHNSNSLRENYLHEKNHFKSKIHKPLSFSLNYEIRKAGDMLLNINSNNLIKDRSFVKDLIRNAKGLAFLTVLKFGFLGGVHMGTGLLVKRHVYDESQTSSQYAATHGWSAPLAIGTGGFSFGAQVGGELNDFMFILNTDEAVQSFSGKGHVQIGAEAGLCLGPYGRSGGAELAAGNGGISSIYTYAQSRGIYGGVSVDGGLIVSRNKINFKFYGRVLTEDIILNQLEPPIAANPLYDALNIVLGDMNYFENRIDL